jgi:hypothetical protein
MNAKHTQGPWGYRRAFSNGEPCGMVITPMGYDLNTSNEEENEANARLIAAAPELLAALQELIRMQVKGHDLIDRMQFSPEGRRISDLSLFAIAKAKGEA